MVTRIFLSICISATMLAQGTTTADNKTPATTPTTTSSSTDALKSAQALLLKAKYAEAAVAFKALVEKEPTSGEAHAGLIRSLYRAEQLDEAEAAAKNAISALPQSAVVHAAYGDLYYRRGKLGEAEGEYRGALKQDANSARGWWGIARIYQAVSMHKHARDAFAKAHELDPSDPQIVRSWLATESAAKRFAGLRENILKSHSGDAPYNAIASALSEGRIWTLATEIKRTDIRLDPIFQDGTHMSGFGLKVRLNDGTSFVPKLDTGASGLVMGRKLAERAGVIKLADSEFGGIGDSGSVQGYLGWVEKINIGDVEFRNCIVEVSSKSDVADDSGLLGGNVFDKFLITIDFKDRRLQLAPLPQNPAADKNDDEAQDRYIAPEMQSYTKVFRFGKDLVVPVVVSDKTTGLFILDTG